jgi:hypothetical protein
VNEGVAECIMAANYPMDLSFMKESHRFNMLKKLAERNSAIKRNSVHISLNFAPGEKLDNEKLQKIAADYMQGIGFGNQPYLIYQHFDAGHPHIHIVTTRTQADGTGIATHNIGKKKSEPIRKAIEEKYRLVRAEDHRRDLFRLKPVNLEKVIYGRIDSKRAMNNVLEYVLEKYRFTNLPQLNAVLNLYNIHADRGGKDSRIFENNGLTFKILGPEGQYLGVPVKASSFFSNPTLKKLGEKFVKNALKNDEHKSKLRMAIDMAYLKSPDMRITDLVPALKQSGIDVVLRFGDKQVIYGVTFVDHRSRQVFNGGELGKAYSAHALQNREAFKQQAGKNANATRNTVNKPDSITQQEPGTRYDEARSGLHSGDTPGEFEKSLVQIYLQYEQTYDYQPSQRIGRRKRALKKKVRKKI